MEKNAIKTVLTDASEMAAELPQHLQEKGFELAVGLLVGSSATNATDSQELKKQRQSQPQRRGDDGDLPAVSDLLKVCKQNNDKYVVFLYDLEDKAEPATPNALLGEFKEYRVDKPANVYRDLQRLSAADWAKPASKERGAAYELREKGRKRYAELVAALRNEQ